MANLMDLVRELKALNAKKKSGVALSPDEIERRKSLKKYLKTAMANPPAPSREGAAARSKANQAPVSSTEASQPGQQPVAVDNAFAVNAGSLFDEAMASPAQRPQASQTQPPQTAEGKSTGDYSMPSASFKHVSERDIMSAEQKAEDAAGANRKRQRATAPDAIKEEIKSVASQSNYTPSRGLLVQEQYYASYHDDGFDSLDDQAPVVDLPTVDSRDVPLNAFSLDHPLAKFPPPGLAFLDDFPVLYKRKILLPPGQAMVADLDDPNLLVKGKRKVTLHLQNGQILRGSINALARGALGFSVKSGDQDNEFAFSQIKALFVHLKADAVAAPQGHSVKVLFHDGRGVKGHTDDYAPDAAVFSLVPGAKYERIIVPSTAVKQISQA